MTGETKDPEEYRLPGWLGFRPEWPTVPYRDSDGGADEIHEERLNA